MSCGSTWRSPMLFPGIQWLQANCASNKDNTVFLELEDGLSGYLQKVPGMCKQYLVIKTRRMYYVGNYTDVLYYTFVRHWQPRLDCMHLEERESSLGIMVRFPFLPTEPFLPLLYWLSSFSTFWTHSLLTISSIYHEHSACGGCVIVSSCDEGIQPCISRINV